MSEKRPALGRGLSALIPNSPAPLASAPDRAGPSELDIDLLTTNPKQPRTQIDEKRLEELAQSIRTHGVLQPIVTRKVGEHYEIVAGERRWRAAQRAGLLKVPVVLREIADDELLAIALIENIQRDDLNPIEEAHAYQRLSEELQLTQEAIANAVGKDRATIANFIRLLRLPAEVRTEVGSGTVTMGHARALLALADEAAQRRISREIITGGLSVRDTEAIVRRETTPPTKTESQRADPNTRAAEERLRIALGTRVHIIRKGKRGKIEIEFGDEDELNRLYEQLTQT